jgi:hypothetical protein
MLPADFPSAIVDGAASAQLRLAALCLGDGGDLSRCDDHQIVEPEFWGQVFHFP